MNLLNFIGLMAIFIIFIIYLKNRKENGMTKKGIAKILSVEFYTKQEYNFQTKSNVIHRHYDFKYDFEVGTDRYTGCGHSIQPFLAPKKGKKVKIYYNPQNPSQNKTRSEYNERLKLALVICVILFGCIYYGITL